MKKIKRMMPILGESIDNETLGPEFLGNLSVLVTIVANEFNQRLSQNALTLDEKYGGIELFGRSGNRASYQQTFEIVFQEIGEDDLLLYRLLCLAAYSWSAATLNTDEDFSFVEELYSAKFGSKYFQEKLGKLRSEGLKFGR